MTPGEYFDRHGRLAQRESTAFTTENGVSPPKELVELFRMLEISPSEGSSRQYVVRDVCMGFCYDPKAGLGYTAENQRCGYGVDGRERCY